MVDDEPMRPHSKDMSTLNSGQCTSFRDAGAVSQIRIIVFPLRQARRQLDLHISRIYILQPDRLLKPAST